MYIISNLLKWPENLLRIDPDLHGIYPCHERERKRDNTNMYYTSYIYILDDDNQNNNHNLENTHGKPWKSLVFSV